MAPAISVTADHPLYDPILSCCNAAELLRLARTCKAFRNTILDFIPRAFDINRNLLQFFADPVGFRTMQSDTGAVVSGSFALQFFIRAYYPLADLDIYVEAKKSEHVGRWLLRNGYTYVAVKKDCCGTTFQQDKNFKLAVRFLEHGWIGDEFNCGEVKGVLNFFGEVGGVTRKVQLIVTEGCAIEAILKFSSTCVMNFITYEKAYCLYPLETIDTSRSLMLGKDTEEASKFMEKYHDRGFSSCKVADGNSFRYQEVRWVEDQSSWVIPLPDIGLGSRFIPTNPIRLTTWSIASVPGEGHWVHFHRMYTHTSSVVHPLISGTHRLSDAIHYIHMDLYAHGYMTLTASKDRNTSVLADEVLDMLKEGDR